MTEFYVGVDLAQAQDYTAVAILKTVAPGKRYNLVHLDRFQKTYTDTVRLLKTLMGRDPLQRSGVLIADATGVGRPIIDMLRGEGLRPISVLIHGGVNTTQDPETKFWHVPKVDLVSTLDAALQTPADVEPMLQIAAGLSLADVLVSELQNFRAKPTPNGHMTYAAREGQHDDLLLAVSLALWWGKKRAVDFSILNLSAKNLIGLGSRLR